MSTTILMIHGMMTTAICWMAYRGFFEKLGYRCLVPTLRHHEMRPDRIPDPRLSETGLLDYVDDMEQLIQGLPEPPIVLGHSLGGLIAQILIGRSRVRVSAGVLITPAPPQGVFLFTRRNLRTLAGIVLRPRWWRSACRLSSAATSYGVFNRMPIGMHERLHSFIVPESGRTLLQVGFPVFDSEKASRVDERGMTVPLLVIGAAHDNLVPSSVVKRIHGKYRANAVYREYDNHAHFIISEPGWERVAGDIYAWLEGLAGRRHGRE